MKVAGLFSGVGGIELGFQQAGFEVVWSNEIDKNASVTFKENYNHTLVVEDVSNIKSDELPDVDVIVGGFPCQAFSVAGYRKGFEDERGEIFFQMARIIKSKRPKVVFIENVKNLLTHDNGNTYKVIRETLESLGYYVKYSIMNACEYGDIPQNRERIYIIAFLNKSDFDSFKFPDKKALSKTISDVINFKDKVDSKYYYTKEKTPFYDVLVREINNPDTVYQWRRKYVRENKSNMIPTLTANMGMGGHNVPLVLTQFGIRKMTPKECFVAQGYPDDFVIPKLADSHLYKQAGNSVVVPVIKSLAEAINLALKVNK